MNYPKRSKTSPRNLIESKLQKVQTKAIDVINVIDWIKMLKEKHYNNKIIKIIFNSANFALSSFVIAIFNKCFDERKKNIYWGRLTRKKSIIFSYLIIVLCCPCSFVAFDPSEPSESHNAIVIYYNVIVNYYFLLGLSRFKINVALTLDTYQQFGSI